VKQKLERFRIISERDNVLEPGKEIYFEVRGHWNSMFFKNENPITLELACGRGEYTVGLANRFPNRNYVGLDLKGDRIWKGSTLAVEQNLTNVAFVRAQILTIENFFQIGEVDEIWLTFPDPRPKVRDIKRRLTNSRFLDLYKKVLKPEGFFRFKTDNTDLFHYTLEELATRNDIVNLRLTEDLYDSDLQPECFDIQTKYEQMFSEQGEKIKYLRFNFDH